MSVKQSLEFNDRSAIEIAVSLKIIESDEKLFRFLRRWEGKKEREAFYTCL